MPDPVTVRKDLAPRSMGGGDIILRTTYEAPGGSREDQYSEYDLWAAKRMQSLLLATYPGYPWACQFDSTHKIAKIGIPILMGVLNWYVINLVQTELTPHTVVAGAGEILERYRQSRMRFSVGSFLDAREQHSALVRRGRAVPG
jgi:hypothetical protein